MAAYRPDGSKLTEFSAFASNVSCPVFGGENCSELRATTALEHLDEAERAKQPDGGKVFRSQTSYRGQVEAMYKL